MMRPITFFFFFPIFFGLYSQDTVYTKKLEKLTEKGYAHYGVHKDSGQYYFNKIKKIALDNRDTLSAVDMLITSTRHLGYFYDLQAMKINLTQIDSLLTPSSSSWNLFPDKLLYQNSVLYDKGNYYFKLGKYPEAKDFFSQIRNSYNEEKSASQGTSHLELLSGAISFLAKIHYQEGKFDLAKNYYLENIQLIRNHSPVNQTQLNINFALLAEVLEEQGNILEANVYLRNTLRESLISTRNPNRIITVANHLANNHVSLSQLDSTAYYLSVMKGYVDQNPSFKYLYHRTRAHFFSAKKNLPKAISEIDTALTLYYKRPGELNNKLLGTICREGAQLAISNNGMKKALDYLNKGIEANEGNLDIINLELKALKTEVLTKNKEYIKASEIAKETIKSLDSLKPDYLLATDKINLIESTFPLFEAVIESNTALFHENGKTTQLERVFYFMEKSKSVLLMEALRGARADQFANVPDSLLEKERSLRSEITSLEKELAIAKGNDPNLRSRIFNLRDQQIALIRHIETRYPKYFDLRYGAQVVDFQHMLETLDKDQLLISYFFGDTAIYGLSLGHHENKVLKIPYNDDLRQQLVRYQQLISNPRSEIAEIHRLGHQLYKKLLAPLVTPNVNRLLIIPDGNLNFVPFGTLSISDKPGSYLVKNYSVDYSNSATLFNQLLKTNHTGEQLLALAPDFNNEYVNPSATRDHLAPLPHNQSEVTSILSSYQGLALVAEKATLANFLNNADKYSILHFATHSVFNDAEPEYSYLAFMPTTEEHLLFVKDLYNLSLNADLVTLSACETGIGELKRGEGFLSLARGFFYSGAKSIASTLWKVNDASSSEIMGAFYRYLSEGATKDQALQQAKLEFLANNVQNARKHPYYWAGYIISGDTQPIRGSDFKWAWLLGGGLLVSGAVYWVGKKAA